MRKLLTAAMLIMAFAVSGCASLQQIPGLVTAATTTITNPVGPVDIYRVKNVYAATLQLAVDYRGYCWAKPYAALTADPVAKSLCQNRRAIVRAIQAARLKASVAIRAADTFAANNPTINAQTVVLAAWQAVTDFRNAIPAVN